ncbi:unnamed protein product [Sphagnum balticum]
MFHRTCAEFGRMQLKFAEKLCRRCQKSTINAHRSIGNISDQTDPRKASQLKMARIRPVYKMMDVLAREPIVYDPGTPDESTLQMATLKPTVLRQLMDPTDALLMDDPFNVDSIVDMQQLFDARAYWGHKAAKMCIPTVAICDTNADPRLVTYPIAANDDSTPAIELYLNLFKEAIRAGKRGILTEQEKKTPSAELESIALKAPIQTETATATTPAITKTPVAAPKANDKGAFRKLLEQLNKRVD